MNSWKFIEEPLEETEWAKRTTLAEIEVEVQRLSRELDQIISDIDEFSSEYQETLEKVSETEEDSAKRVRLKNDAVTLKKKYDVKRKLYQEKVIKYALLTCLADVSELTNTEFERKTTISDAITQVKDSLESPLRECFYSKIETRTDEDGISLDLTWTHPDFPDTEPNPWQKNIDLEKERNPFIGNDDSTEEDLFEEIDLPEEDVSEEFVLQEDDVFEDLQ